MTILHKEKKKLFVVVQRLFRRWQHQRNTLPAIRKKTKTV